MPSAPEWVLLVAVQAPAQLPFLLIVLVVVSLLDSIVKSATGITSRLFKVSIDYIHSHRRTQHPLPHKTL